jgi:TrmH family RNA methyltransferase
MVRPFRFQMITSPDNPKLKLVRKLAERRWREKEGAFVTEGEDLLTAGLAANAEPIAVLVDPESGIDGEAVEPALLAAVSALGSGTRVIATWPIPPEPAIPEEGVCVYLHGIADPGNVGTIIRSADALGAAALVCGRGCADPYGPKAIRATMGSIFSLPIPVAPFEATPAPRMGLVAAGGEPLPGAAAALAGGGTLCLGAEREGLPAEIVEYCDLTATIPIRPGVDSLNVAAAAAIALERIHSAAVEAEWSGG